jgi:hypothetical protein
VTVRLTLLLQRVAVVAAAVALLGHGGVELAPRLLAGGASVAAASGGTPAAARPATFRPVTSRPVTSQPAAESQPAPAASVLRLALALAAPAGSADTAAGPGSSPLAAPHLLVRPGLRPATPSYVRGIRGSASGRAPPAAAGT